MWVVYHRGERRIVGLTADADIDADKEMAVAEVVQGLIVKSDIAEYDAILVRDREKAMDYMAAFPNKLALTEGTAGLKVVIREPEAFALYVTCDAPDKHPVDGIPEIRADGKAYTTISIQKINERFKAQRGPQDNDLLYLRTDYGSLRNAGGTKQINSIKLKKGHATLRLVSEPFRRVATVQIISAKPDLPGAFIRVEFI
ncbi:MAG: hypothetical protein JSW39_01370 [Desulfobacterales bacterium]|nr:MAG: hypothetical protein JSW39_01370 [Desulfobacterales bacterium]